MLATIRNLDYVVLLCEDMERMRAFYHEILAFPVYRDWDGWLEMLISIGVLFAIAFLIGAGPWMLSNIAPSVSNFLSSAAVIFGLSVFVHVVLVLPTALVHKLLARATGVDVA